MSIELRANFDCIEARRSQREASSVNVNYFDKLWCFL
jgi:hypothetical protein